MSKSKKESDWFGFLPSRKSIWDGSNSGVASELSSITSSDVDPMVQSTLNEDQSLILLKPALYYGTIRRSDLAKSHDPYIDFIRIANYYHRVCQITIHIHEPWLTSPLSNPIRIPAKHLCNIPIQLNHKVTKLADKTYRFNSAVTIHYRYTNTEREMSPIDVLFSLVRE